MMRCAALRTYIRTWLRDYVRIQGFAVILLYVQVRFLCSFARNYGISAAFVNFDLFSMN